MTCRNRRHGFAATGRSGDSHRGSGVTSASVATTYRPAAVTDPGPARYPPISRPGAGARISMTERADQDPVLTPAMIRQFASDHLAGADPKTPLASPLFASLAGLPPLLVQAGTAELLLSDSERLARAAAEAGVDVTLQIGEGLPHAYQIMLGTPEAAEATDQIGKFLRAGVRWKAAVPAIADSPGVMCDQPPSGPGQTTGVVHRVSSAVHHPPLSCPRRAGQRQLSPVSGQQPVQPRRRLGDDLRGFTSQLLVPGAGYVCQRPVQLMYGANPLAAPAAPGVLRDSGTAASETVVTVGVQVQHPAAHHPAQQDPAGARTDSSPADLVRELVHERTPVLD